MTPDMTIEGGVLAVIETGATGEPTAASIEMLGAAHTLARGLGREFAVAVVAEEGRPPSLELAGCGAQRVYEVRFPGGAGSAGEQVTHAAWLAIQEAHPAVMLFPDGGNARVSAASIASRLQAEFVSGCTMLKVRDGVVQMGRPCLSGKAFAHLEWRGAGPVVVTVAAGAFSPLAAGTGDVSEVVVMEAASPPAGHGVTVLSELLPTPEEMSVNDADVLVAGGRGVGGAEGFGLLVELARRLGGTVAASRVAVDSGWIPSSRQIGLTGKTVSPRLYLALGISGAPQHIAGIR
jgi:electron transfer flavoprotein alpha subunit